MVELIQQIADQTGSNHEETSVLFPVVIHFLEKEIHKKEVLTNLIAKHLELSIQDCVVHPYRYSAENAFNQ